MRKQVDHFSFVSDVVECFLSMFFYAPFDKLKKAFLPDVGSGSNNRFELSVKLECRDRITRHREITLNDGGSDGLDVATLRCIRVGISFCGLILVIERRSSKVQIVQWMVTSTALRYVPMGTGAAAAAVGVEGAGVAAAMVEGG